MFERMCLDRWSDNPKACLQKLGDKDSCICIETSWLVDRLEMCLGSGLRNEVRFSLLGTLSTSNCLVFLVKPTRQLLSY